MNRLVKVLFIIAVGLLLAKSSLSAAIFLWPKTEIDSTGNEAAAELVQLTNTYRKGLGLSELAVNPRLTQAAINKAKDLLSKQYFSHTSPSGRRFSDWVKDVNYAYFYVGENLAMDFDTPQEIFDAWLKSPKHRENIERSEFQEIGIADLKGKFADRETSMVVQLFGSRVLGANEMSDASASPNMISNYFGSASADNGYSKYFGLINNYLNYILFAAIMMLIFTIVIRKSRNKKSAKIAKQNMADRPIIRVSAKKQAPPLVSLYTKRELAINNKTSSPNKLKTNK